MRITKLVQQTGLLSIAILVLGLTFPIYAQKSFDKVTKKTPKPIASKPSFPTNSLKDGFKEGEDIIEIPIDLVTVDVNVLDHDHNVISDLTQSQFSLFEDKIKQQVEFFAHDDSPISLGLVIDTSGSMRMKLPKVVEAAKTLVHLSNPSDEICLVGFKEEASLLEEYTTQKDEIESALDDLGANQGTALLDAIYVAANYAAESAHNRRKVLVIITDGDERDSFYKAEDLINQLRSQDVQLYIIGFPEGLSDENGLFHKSARNRAEKLIKMLAIESGGQAFFPTCLYDVQAFAEKIANEIHSQYTLGYFSSNEKQDGSWRQIEVKLAKKDCAVRTRTGYFASPSKRESAR